MAGEGTRLRLNDRTGGPGAPVVRTSLFEVAGGAAELHVTVAPRDAAGLAEQIAEIERAYAGALEEAGFEPSSAVLRRVFASDLANQAEALARSPLLGAGDPAAPVAASWVEQPPLPRTKLALWAWHVRPAGEAAARQRRGLTVAVPRGDLVHLFTTNVGAAGGATGATAYQQTHATFDRYERELEAFGGTLRDHVLRTWVFVQGIDRNYMGMVDARRDLFASRGLTDATHFIASTGIEGRGEDPRRIIQLDAYAVSGIAPERVVYLRAPQNLSRTIRYGVTFERAVRVDYGDRRHVLLSGTASIDRDGHVLHVGDVRRQTERTAENIEALLDEAGATPGDLAQLIVYVRDPADGPYVGDILRERWPGVPAVTVRGAVCRRQWLVEVEGSAIVPTRDPRYPGF